MARTLVDALMLRRTIALLVCVSGCAPESSNGFARLALDAESCSVDNPCPAGLVCVEAAQGPDANRCEEPRALYSFLEVDTTEDGLVRAVDQVLGNWATERALTPLTTRTYPMVLASGERVSCYDSEGGPPRDCWVPEWASYLRPTSIADKYDRFALFGLRNLRFLVSGWRNATDAEITAAASVRGVSLSPLTWRINFRNTVLAALDSFTKVHFPFALTSDPAPSTSAGWLNPNGAFDPGMALWDPASNYNCKTAKTGVLVPGFSDLYYYDLRSSIWDRHASAFRVMTLINAYFQLRGVLTLEQRERWLRVLRENGDELAMSSSFEPGQNHGISEAAALLQLSIEFEGHSPSLIPDSTSLSTSWRALATSRLNDVISDTILSDGAQNEQSLFYHHYELSFLMEIEAFLARHPEVDLGQVSSNVYDRAVCENGTVFDHQVRPTQGLALSELLSSSVRVAVHTTMPSAAIPMLGSSPDANLLEFFDTAYDRYSATHSTVAARQLDFVRSFGARGAPPPISERMQVFDASGYVTLRSAFVPRPAAQTHVFFNTAVAAHAHSHLDTLSVHVYAANRATAQLDDGLALLVDSGWFSYASPERHYFESTQAHNTVSVDGLNQCSWDPTDKRADPADASSVLTSCSALPQVPQGSPGWPAGGSQRGATLRDASGTSRVLYQSATASAYPGVSHARGVALLGSNMLLVLDRVTGSAPHTLRQNWHLSPAIKEVEQLLGTLGNHYQFRDAAGVPLFSGHFVGPGATRALAGACGPCSGNLCGGNACTDPRQGWYSTIENQKVQAWVVERSVSASDVTWASLFLLGEVALQSAELSLESSAGGRDIRADFTLSDGLSAGVQVTDFGVPGEQVAVAYPFGAVLASYSFEAEPAADRDLAEALGVSVTIPGETSGNVSAVDGVVGRAYRYDAGSTLLGSSNSFSFMHQPRAAFSISFWMRMNSVYSGSSGGIQAIFSTATWSSAGTGIQLYFDDEAPRNNALKLVIRGNGGTPLSVGSNGMVPDDGLFHYYTVTFDSKLSQGQARFYRDGVVVTTGGVAGTLSSAAPDTTAVIGKKPGGSLVYPLHATLDELVVFKRALSASDVTQLYNGGRGVRAH
ncbi:MAG: heparinase II/III domain-containing protein [Myxococcota bacterium]